MVHRDELIAWVDDYLAIDDVRDYGPNGLQVEGAEQVDKIALGVTSSQAFLERVHDWGAQMAMVHHGLFWKGPGQMRVVRSMRARLKLLLENDINLAGYHLPLDRHMEIGNNAVLARDLEAIDIEPAFEMDGATIGVTARFDPPVASGELFARIAKLVERDPMIIDGGPQTIARVGIVSGAAPRLIEDAITAGLDLFMTGEPNEPSTHLAREEGIHFVAAGHHATERCGIQALGEKIRERFGVETRFFDVNNPV